MEIKSAEFAYTAVDEGGFRRSTLPEIALIGRSNVGKSSLINTFCRRNGLARVSGTPGKTREVNYYLLNGAFYLVDLPGYGHASVSKAEKDRWAEMIEGYFSASQNLKLALLLVDIRHDPSDDDRQAAQWIEHIGVPCRIVATKADKIVRSQRALTCRSFSDRLGMTFRQEAIAFSTLEKMGREDLLSAVGDALR